MNVDVNTPYRNARMYIIVPQERQPRLREQAWDTATYSEARYIT